MTKSIQDNFVKVFLLDLPVAHHSRCQAIPLRRRYVQSARIVVWMIFSAFLSIFHILGLCVPRTILIAIDNSEHVMAGELLPRSWSSTCITIFIHCFVHVTCIHYGSLCHRFTDPQNIVFLIRIVPTESLLILLFAHSRQAS